MAQTKHPKTDASETEPRTIVDEAAEAADTAKSKAQTVAGNAKDRAAAEAEMQASRVTGAAAREVSGAAAAMQGAADNLPEGTAAERGFSQLADSLSGAAEEIRGRDLGQIAEDLRRFARDNPMLFVGSAALIGMAAARFAKARRPLQAPRLSRRHRTPTTERFIR